MYRPCLAMFVWWFAASATVAAEDLDPAKPSRSDEHVHWTPQRNVKEAIHEEINRFEKSLKTKLGPKILAHRPYEAEKNAPNRAPLEATTIEQIVDRVLKELRRLADHDNEEFMPVFAAFRRTPAAGGCDLLSAPVGLLNRLGHHSGSVTFKFEWEKVDGRFKNNWDHDDVDEAYEVELNATLTLGIDLTLKSGNKLTVISHSETKPIVHGWWTTLVASEGKVQKILNTPQPKDGD